jgi:uncharacterized protein DUF1616
VRRADLDLKLLALVAGLGLLAGLAVDEPAARALPAVLLVLVAPGYALSLVLFPDRRDPAERWLLALGLSLALAVVCGLVLDLLGIPLDSRSWSITLGLLTLALTTVAWQARSHLPREAPRRGDSVARVRPPRGRPAMAIGAAAVVVILVAGVLIAREPAGSAHVRGYSMLWALPGKTTASAFRFTVGVRSQELHALRYRLVGTAGNRVVYRRQFGLRPGQDWSGRGTLRQSQTGFGFVDTLRFTLYRADRPRVPYRQVFLSPGSGA